MAGSGDEPLPHRLSHRDGGTRRQHLYETPRLRHVEIRQELARNRDPAGGLRLPMLEQELEPHRDGRIGSDTGCCLPEPLCRVLASHEASNRHPVRRVDIVEANGVRVRGGGVPHRPGRLRRGDERL